MKQIDITINPKTGEIEQAEWVQGAPGGQLCSEELKRILAGVSQNPVIKPKKDTQAQKTTQKIGG
jgi:hypothetical protein